MNDRVFKITMGVLAVAFIIAIVYGVRDSMWVREHCTVSNVYTEMREDEDDLFGDDDQWRVITYQCDNGTTRVNEAELDD